MHIANAAARAFSRSLRASKNILNFSEMNKTYPRMQLLQLGALLLPNSAEFADSVADTFQDKQLEYVLQMPAPGRLEVNLTIQCIFDG